MDVMSIRGVVRTENHAFSVSCTELSLPSVSCVAEDLSSSHVSRYPTSSLIKALGLRMFLRCQSGKDFLAPGLDLWSSKRKIAPDLRIERFRAATVFRTWQ